MASDTLPVLHNPDLPQVVDGMFGRAIERVTKIVKPAASSLSVTAAYQQLVVAHLRLINSTYAAIAKLNMGEAEQAQTILQGSIADIEGSL